MQFSHKLPEINVDQRRLFANMIAGWITSKWPVQGLASAALATYGVEWVEAAAQQGDIGKLAESLRADAPDAFTTISQFQLEEWLKQLIAAFTKTAKEARA